MALVYTTIKTVSHIFTLQYWELHFSHYNLFFLLNKSKIIKELEENKCFCFSCSVKCDTCSFFVIEYNIAMICFNNKRLKSKKTFRKAVHIYLFQVNCFSYFLWFFGLWYDLYSWQVLWNPHVRSNFTFSLSYREESKLALLELVNEPLSRWACWHQSLFVHFYDTVHLQTAWLITQSREQL